MSVSKRDWCVLVLLTGAMMFSIVDRIGIAVLIEPIKRDLNINDTAFGLFNGLAFGLVYSLMGLPFGWLADRWSRKGAITLGIVIWSLATAGCGMATGFGAFLFSRLFVGAGEAGLAPAAYGILHDRFGRGNLATVISVLQMGSALGSGCGLLITSYVYAFYAAAVTTAIPIVGHYHPWQLTFLSIAMPGIFFALAIPFIRDRRHPLAHPQVSEDPGETGASLLGELRLNRMFYLCLFGGMAGISCIFYAILSWMPAILGREFGWTPAHAGMTFGLVMLITGPAGLLCGGGVSDYLTRRGYARAYSLVPLVAAIMILPGALCLPLAQRPDLLLAAAALINFALFLPIGVVPAYLQVAAPAPVRARMSAFYVLSNNIFGLGISSVLIGRISAGFQGGSETLKIIVGICCLACSVSAIACLALLHFRATKPLDNEVHIHPV